DDNITGPGLGESEHGRTGTRRREGAGGPSTHQTGLLRRQAGNHIRLFRQPEPADHRLGAALEHQTRVVVLPPDAVSLTARGRQAPSDPSEDLDRCTRRLLSLDQSGTTTRRLEVCCQDECPGQRGSDEIENGRTTADLLYEGKGVGQT